MFWLSSKTLQIQLASMVTKPSSGKRKVGKHRVEGKKFEDNVRSCPYFGVKDDVVHGLWVIRMMAKSYFRNIIDQLKKFTNL